MCLRLIIITGKSNFFPQFVVEFWTKMELWNFHLWIWTWQHSSASGHILRICWQPVTNPHSQSFWMVLLTTTLQESAQPVLQPSWSTTRVNCFITLYSFLNSSLLAHICIYLRWIILLQAWLLNQTISVKFVSILSLSMTNVCW